VIGSFIGLLFLVSAYTAIGIFASTISKNQIVSFLIAVCISFVLFYGFEALSNSNIFGNLNLAQFGINEHFNSISKGVIDTRDLIYFVSVTYFFLFLTKKSVQNEK